MLVRVALTLPAIGCLSLLVLGMLSSRAEDPMSKLSTLDCLIARVLALQAPLELIAEGKVTRWWSKACTAQARFHLTGVSGPQRAAEAGSTSWRSRIQTLVSTRHVDLCPLILHRQAVLVACISGGLWVWSAGWLRGMHALQGTLPELHINQVSEFVARDNLNRQGPFLSVTLPWPCAALLLTEHDVGAGPGCKVERREVPGGVPGRYVAGVYGILTGL